MYLETTNIYSDDRVEVTSRRDVTYSRYPGVMTDLIDGTYLQKFYFTTNGSAGTRFVSVDYQGISRDTFPMIANRGHILWLENIPGIYVRIWPSH